MMPALRGMRLPFARLIRYMANDEDREAAFHDRIAAQTGMTERQFEHIAAVASRADLWMMRTALGGSVLFLGIAVVYAVMGQLHAQALGVAPVFLLIALNCWHSRRATIARGRLSDMQLHALSLSISLDLERGRLGRGG